METTYTEDTLKAFYACGYHLYENGQYEQSLHFFRTLTQYQPDSQKVWMGLGGTHQMLKEFDKALQAYSFAAMLDESNPLPHFHAFECLRELGRDEEGRKALKSAQLVAKKDEKYKDLAEQLALIKMRLRR